MTCTGSYRVTAEDARLGRITNTAVATAEGGVRSEPDRVTVRVEEKKPCKGKHCKPCDGHHGKQSAASCRRDGATAA
jgi:hypothetical protein